MGYCVTSTSGRGTATDAAEADMFYAILGTPNGAGSGFLLATHKTELGVKRFKSVTVWNHPLHAQSNLPVSRHRANLS
jgi:ABC-type cobalamin transport system ATPase subunit